MEKNITNFDLMSTVEYGGCSAKLSPKELSNLLSNIPLIKNKNILVDIESHDDAGVYQINENTALIATTDFFPPVCSDAYTFGQIAAANSLSDIYAMGGTPLLTLNINMFPSDKIPLEILRDILLGGQDKVNESGAFTMGGHTIEDSTPKYGLAVVGTIDPKKLITNKGAQEGQKLILTKPLGIGVILAAKKLNMCSTTQYKEALHQMMLLNKIGAEMMLEHNVTGATDITGFGLIGHAMRMAQASGVTFAIESKNLPIIDGVDSLIDEGCIPGAVFRNIDFTKDHVLYSDDCSIISKMLIADAQTSGGLLFSVDSDIAKEVVINLRSTYPQASIIGNVTKKEDKDVIIK